MSMAWAACAHPRRRARAALALRRAAALLRYIARKGSICVDGVSLTVNEVDDAGFEVALIPHTVANTAFAATAVGDAVNLEVDLVARYVERLLACAAQPCSRSARMSFAPIPELLEEIRAGRMVVIVDDEDRENEGDLIMAAELVSRRTSTSWSRMRAAWSACR